MPVQLLITAPVDIVDQVSLLVQAMYAVTTGQPLIEVIMKKVKKLRKLGLTWTKIADILQISRQALYRRLDGSCLIGYRT